MNGSSPVVTWPAPPSVTPSPDFTVEAAGVPVFVYQAPVRAEILRNDGLWTHRRDYAAERASIALFDMRRAVTVRIRPARPFASAAVLPERAGVAARIEDGSVVLALDRPRKLTVILDGDDRSVLHLFAGAPEAAPPDASSPDVLYFGPGVHEIGGLVLRSGQTVYLAGGAVLRPRLREGDEGVYSEKWKVTFFQGAVFDLKNVENVTVRGRGVVDAGLIPHPGWAMFSFSGARRVRVEGLTLLNAANWNFAMRASEDVEVRDVRIVSGRLNSDGINSCNSQRMRIRDCFVRNHDDSIVVKTNAPDRPAEDIEVEDCVIWNDWGYALGVTYETRSPVRRVRFRRNDIIYARHWCMGIHVSDSATIEDVVFEDTAVSDLARACADSDPARKALTVRPKLFKAVVTADVWGHDPERGRIRSVRIDGVTVYGTELPPVELRGADAAHDIRGIVFSNVRLAGRPPIETLAALHIEQNSFVSDVRLEGER